MHTTNGNVVRTKHFFDVIRRTINASIGLLVLTGFIYILFWSGIMTDESIYEAGKGFFEPLAKLFFQKENSFDIYKNTGLILFAISIPVALLYGIANSIEDKIVKSLYWAEEKKEEAKKQKAFLESLKEYDEINNFTICLSLNIEGEISTKNKNIINNGILETIKNNVKKAYSHTYIETQGVSIITCYDFTKYDVIYDTILKTLSEIKPKLETRYNIKITPTITTDAHTQKESSINIKEKHFGIKSFNHQNRSCTTGTFAKKYKYVNCSKYIGIPIGEYIGSKNNETYELNVIHKNLTRTLASI